jgi:hypothetical protein
MKKVILVIMGIVCLLMAGKVQAQCTFSDVPESHVFYDYITGMCELGITTGYPDGTFRPSQNVTRGQMSAFIMRTIDNVVKPKGPIPNFEGEVCWLAQKTEDEQGPTNEQPRIVRSRINYINGTYIITTIMEVAGYDPLISNGIAEVVGDKIITTANESFDYSPWRISGISRSVIDKNTLNGTAWVIRNNFNTSLRTYDSEYIVSTLTLTTCP